MSILQFRTWNDLIDRDDEFGMKSYPNNPMCACASESCSKYMFMDNVCFWHHHRMGILQSVQCDCGTWQTVNGDAIGRNQAISYLKLDRYSTPVIDITGRLYCCPGCQNADNYKWKCGDMFVCSNNKDKHTMLVDAED